MIRFLFTLSAFCKKEKKDLVLLFFEYLDVKGFDIKGEDGFRGFVKGLVAASGDNEYIYIDGIARITGKELAELSDIFGAMDKLEKDYGVKFVLTCSAAKEDLPEFVLKYVD